MYRTESPVATTSTPSRPRRRRGTVRMVGALVALSVGGFGLIACGTASPAGGYENLSYAGENPFTQPVGADDPNVKPVEGGGGEQAGDTQGLYAQNPDSPSCDPVELVRNLQADDAKAKAWAEVLGIEVTEIPEFVNSLTPVVLRSNTAVTNYSYVDGTYRADPAVLAAGTAVFVNLYGEPTVKCYSGNPLTRGTSADPAVTTVTPSRTVITRATYVHPGNGATVVKEHKPTKEQLRIAFESALKTAERAATVAKAARSNADLAQKARDEADKNVKDSRTAVADQEKAVQDAQQALDDAIDNLQSPDVIKMLREQVRAAEAELAERETHRDDLIKVAAEKKAEHDRLEMLAKDSEAAARTAAEQARMAAHAAGLPSPALAATTASTPTTTTPATPVDENVTPDGVEDTPDAPDPSDVQADEPAEPKAADADQPADEQADRGGDAEQGGDVVAEPSAGNGGDDQQ